MDIRDKVVRAWKTIREMLTDRGITDHRTSGVGDAEIRDLVEKSITFAIPVNSDLCIVFHTSPVTVKKQELFNVIGDCKHSLIVFHTKPQGPTIRSLVAQGKEQGTFLEFFDLMTIQYNISRHIYVPKHEKLSAEEGNEILKQYYLKSRFQLPIIFEHDPMARYLGLQHGDIIRITRQSQSNGITLFYRCCKS